MNTGISRILLLIFTLAASLFGQLPTNKDCSCKAIGDDQYLCTCAPKKAEAATKTSTTAASTTTTSATSTTPPATKASTETAATTTKPASTPAGSTDTGTTTTKGQEVYVGPKGGVYHYSDSGKKVYTKKK